MSKEPRSCPNCEEDITDLLDASYEAGFRAGYEKASEGKMPKVLHDELAPPDPKQSAYHNPPR